MNQLPEISSSRWGARTKRIVVIIVLICGGFILINLLSLFPLLILAAVLAYLLWPLVNFIEKWMLSALPFKTRSLAVLLAFLTVIGGLGLITTIIAIVFIDQIAQLGRNLPDVLRDIEHDIEEMLNRPVSINGRVILIDGEPLIPLERLRDITGQQEGDDLIQLQNFDVVAAVQGFISSLGGLTGPAFSVLGTFFNTVINLVFMLVIMFYFVRDGESFAGQLINLTPESYRGDVRRLLYELGRVWNAYLRGQLILCLAVGFAVYVTAFFLGLPNPLILGLIAGMLEFIPNLGPTLALIPAFVVALFSESSTLPFLQGLPYALVVSLAWILIQNLEALFLVPRVMGGNLNLHPVVVIIAVIAGASIAGALGIVLAAPFVASGRVVGQYVYGKLFDIDPFPARKPSTPLRYRIQARMLPFVRFTLPAVHMPAWFGALKRPRIGSDRLRPAAVGEDVISSGSQPSRVTTQIDNEAN